ncbi:DUF302 domain-containing protein [Pseudonocardia sp. MH-G8]|uniref:DUF302 domain-containing protein n=1 Tax=Pseudonocardia sp. MH-G8 TaxID=1854588 RepID=UPI000BA05349|nr:DUF302 domain-containing protein [Pseudonocardia sp. MH-G8]OZM76356.1 ABC transporter ATP-binding protein [Pseudonocardia sp. MH-G8]
MDVAYEHSVTVELPYAEAVTRTREAPAEQGFGVPSEIDVQAALREKRGVEMESYVILGACNPDLAHRALDIDRSIGVLLPCNVVVSGHDRGAKVQIFDPLIMAAVMGREELQSIAQDAARRLQTVLDTLTTRTEEET